MSATNNQEQAVNHFNLKHNILLEVPVNDGNVGIAESLVWGFTTNLEIGVLDHGSIVFFIGAT